MESIHPYLIFSGNCEEAFEFYAQVFGTQIGFSTRYKDGPMEVSSEFKDKIMHMSMSIGEATLMGSDNCIIPSKQEEGLLVGNNVHLSVSYGQEISQSMISERFQKLAVGGTVKMPLQNTFWGSYFGMLVDKYGVHWMFSQEHH